MVLSDIEKMVSVKGMIIRCSLLIPKIREAVIHCLVRGYFSEPINVDRGRVNEPKRCGRQESLAVNSMTLIHNRSRLDSHQGTSIMVNKASLRARELEVNQVILSFIITMNNYSKSFLDGIQTHFGLEACQSGINPLATPKRILVNRGT
ncbi:hypothetical protein GIB67_031398 [Kingdonia uniflora]|uniref:MCM OB domain-containing protein n=1 Tax=Kingdonia uniflora TaxID=39325 RepID=A0A7J7MB06_9MAGN|nr:hypothetical protein GIB67_031398 [Kingdonia uniflora]